MFKVAVYGTLRKGQRNHFLLSDSKFLYYATIPGYIYDLGGCPGYKRGKGDRVACEVYEIDDKTLYRLDNLEGVDYGLYNRITAPGLDDVFIYEYGDTPDHRSLIHNGDWTKE